MDISGFDLNVGDARALPALTPEAITYSLAEQCVRFRVPYSTMIKRFMRNKKKLNSIGTVAGTGCRRRHRRFTNAQFMELLAVLGRRAG